MIKSVTFPEEGTGYIYEKVQKPVRPLKKDYEFRRTRSSYEHDMEEYKKEKAYYDKHKNEYVCPASYNLVGKTFDFQDSKINVLFGPNGSGKTTVIKAIAGNALIDDGFTSFVEPTQLFDLNNELKDLNEIIDKKKRNTSIVDWDGVPIYYDNFEYTKSHSYGVFGGLVGSVIQSAKEEIMYIMDSRQISAGQNTMYIFNKILHIVGHRMSMKGHCTNQFKSRFKGYNGIWRRCGEIQMDHFAHYNNYEKETYPTLIFDEIDKSLDIETVWTLYHGFFPKLVEKYRCQVILVSHSPLILSELIFNNEYYNIISLDQNYTDDVRKMLKGVSF